MEFFKRKITQKQNIDTGMAMVLLLLLFDLKLKKPGYVLIAIALLVLNMTVPRLYKPVAVVWLGLSDLLGNVVSKILMSILFFGVVTPIGFLRRLSGKDSLKLRAFKSGDESVMLTRDHMFVGKDIEKPY